MISVEICILFCESAGTNWRLSEKKMMQVSGKAVQPGFKKDED